MATESVLATQVTLGLVGSGLLQFLKSRAWIPFVNENSKGLNHVVLAVTSAAGALGVNAVWSSTQHSLTITGLSLASVAGGLWIWGKQYAIQFLVHKGAFGSVAAPVATPKP